MLIAKHNVKIRPMFAKTKNIRTLFPVVVWLVLATGAPAQEIIGPGGEVEVVPDGVIEVVPDDSFEPLDQGTPRGPAYPSGSGVVGPDDERPARTEPAPPPPIDRLEPIAPHIEGSKAKKSMNEFRPQVEEITNPQQMRQWIMLDKKGEVEMPPPLPPPLPIREVLFIEEPRTHRRVVPKDVTVNLPPVPVPERPIVGSCEFSSLLPIVLALAGYWFFHYRRRSLI